MPLSNISSRSPYRVPRSLGYSELGFGVRPLFTVCSTVSTSFLDNGNKINFLLNMFLYPILQSMWNLNNTRVFENAGSFYFIAEKWGNLERMKQKWNSYLWKEYSEKLRLTLIEILMTIICQGIIVNFIWNCIKKHSNGFCK